MKLFLDTANLAQIKKLNQMGLVDGVTTNPSLVAKEPGEFEDIIAAICKEVKGDVSAEVVATEFDGMVAEAKHLSSIAPNVVVKTPGDTRGPEGHQGGQLERNTASTSL